MCTLDDCDRTGRNKGGAGLCEGHYYQQRRGRPFAPLNPYGSASDPCAAGDCDTARARGRYCPMHAARVSRHGDPSVVKVPTPLAGPDNPSWSDDPGYSTVHQRLRRSLGSARGHTCSCGRRAYQWAYIGSRAPGQFMPFSTDQSDYAPMCVPCHKRMDLAALRGDPT